MNMKNIIGYKGYQAKIEFSAEDSTLFGTVINTNDKIIFEVDNPEKAMSIFKEVIDDYLILCERKNNVNKENKKC